MNKFVRIDSFDITYADSFARRELKICESFVHTDGSLASKGVGEKRIYVGSNEVLLDEFFVLDKKPKFFIQRSDLVEYFTAAKKELENPTFCYGENPKVVKDIYEKYEGKLSILKEERLYFCFRKTFDNQNRYYLVLDKGRENKKNYDYLRDIALPRITRFLLVKFKEEKTGDYYIYIKPVIWPYGIKMQRDDINAYLGGETEPTSATGPSSTPNVTTSSRKNRDAQAQAKYRDEVLNRCLACVVTKVTDPSLLDACHIKGQAECETDEERYNKYNGFAMTPTIHHLFDIGYLTFDEKGEMQLSIFFRNLDRNRLGLNKTVRIHLEKQTIPFLKWHNQHVYKNVAAEVAAMC